MFRQINTSSLSLDRENDKSVKDFIPNNISNNSRLGKKEERFERREKKGNLFFFPRLRIFKKNLFSMNITNGYDNYNKNEIGMTYIENDQMINSALKKPLISDPDIGLPCHSILDYYLDDDSSSFNLVKTEQQQQEMQQEGQQQQQQEMQELKCEIKEEIENKERIKRQMANPLITHQQSYMKDFMISSNLAQPDHVFSTIPAIFYHEHNLYDQLLKDNVGYLLEFIQKSKLDYATFMFMYPTFISYRLKGADIKSAKKRFNDSHLTFGKMMGRIYCRMDNLKRLLVSFSKGSISNSNFSCSLLLRIQESINHFEMEFKELLSTKHQEINFLGAIMDCENVVGNHDKIVSILHIPFDRQEDLETTIQQMKLNYSIRYQQAVRHADYYQKNDSIKIHRKKQYCLTIFTRHFVLLEIIITSDGSWKYRLNSKMEHSIRPLDKVTLEDYKKDGNIIMIKFIHPVHSIMLVECIGPREKKELLTQFKVIQKEALIVDQEGLNGEMRQINQNS